MSFRIKAADEPPASRLDRFRHAVADSITPFGVRVGAEPEFDGELHSGPIGSVVVTRVAATPLEAYRTSKIIRTSAPDLFKIDVQVRGSVVISQAGRQAALRPADFTLVDLCRPVHLVDTENVHEIVAVKFPRAALPLPYDELARLTAVPMSGRQGLGQPISVIARHLAGHLDDYDAAEGARLSAALLDLLVVALAGRLDRADRVAIDIRHRALLTSIYSFIEKRLGDPGLSPGEIAAAHHFSVRYLHKLFEDQNCTVAEWIRKRRLEGCRRDLADPALADRPVSAIARRWGLTEPTHFSRLFRTTYGDPPGDYRRAHLPPRGD